MKRLTLPNGFLWDHFERGCSGGAVVVARGARQTVVDFPAADLRDFVSDVEHYCSPYGPDAAPPGVKAGAKAARKALERQGVEVPR